MGVGRFPGQRSVAMARTVTTRPAASRGRARSCSRRAHRLSGEPGSEARLDFISYAPKGGEPSFLAAGGLRRILEAPVDAAPRLRKHRARFVGAVADGDDVVPRLIEEPVECLGRVAGDVDAALGHRLN